MINVCSLWLMFVLCDVCSLWLIFRQDVCLTTSSQVHPSQKNVCKYWLLLCLFRAVLDAAGWLSPMLQSSVCAELFSAAQSCLYSRVNCSSPGSSVPGIFQARILQWVAVSYSRGSSQPRDHTHDSFVSCTGTAPPGNPTVLSKFLKQNLNTLCTS